MDTLAFITVASALKKAQEGGGGGGATKPYIHIMRVPFEPWSTSYTIVIYSDRSTPYTEFNSDFVGGILHNINQDYFAYIDSAASNYLGWTDLESQSGNDVEGISLSDATSYNIKQLNQ